MPRMARITLEQVLFKSYYVLIGHIPIRGRQEKFKKFVYPRDNLYSHHIPLAEIGVIIVPLKGSNGMVTPIEIQ